MSGDVHVRFCESVRVRFPRATHLVCGFEHEQDAQRFYKALGLRLEKFGLQVATAKTRILRFCRSDEPGTARFDFLGFEFFWGNDRQGVRRVQRRTSRKKLRNSLVNFTQWCKQSRPMPLRKFFPLLKLKLRGTTTTTAYRVILTVSGSFTSTACRFCGNGSTGEVNA